jgi:hypothetical protein
MNRAGFFRSEIQMPIWIADAHRGDGKRFVVRADDKLTAFLELARMISTHLLTTT